MKVVFCCSEMAPFAKTGGLGDVCGSLPLALGKEELEVCVIMPFYREVQQKNIPFKNFDQDALVANYKGIDIFFIKHETFFNRDGLYGTPRGDYGDNLERFTFFNKRALQLLQDIRLSPDIIHCHDWQTALIPAYLKSYHQGDPLFQKTKTFLTIHNLAYQGIFPRDKFFVLGLPHELNSIHGVEYYGQLSLLKAGLLFSDHITTVSPQYAKEIQHRESGRGMEGVIRFRSDRLSGILNGIDAEYWNPEKDPLIAHPYSMSDMSGKAKNKEVLQKQSGLPVSADIPVFGFIGRLSEQKGIDIFAQSIEEMMQHPVQLVFQGVGEERFENMLRSFQWRFPGKVAAHVKFDEALAHQVYAGSDMLLMPSVYEPCGLSQLIAFRYGTIPVVHHTGGLVDTVMPFKLTNNQGDGFVFSRFDKASFLKAFETAVKVFEDRAIFQDVSTRVMRYDFSWMTSAVEYKKLYQTCLS